jgi:Rad3-related DNA helicase
MEFSLDARTARLSVGEFSAFTVGPHDVGAGGSAGLWRAQLGTHWHNELRAQATVSAPATEFEVPIAGSIVHRGWTLTLTGRIDQLLRSSAAICHVLSDNPSMPPPETCHLLSDKAPPLFAPTTLREIKTVTRALPVDESELRRDYPEYFVQLATYATLWRLGLPSAPHSQLSALHSQLCFVEAQSGLAQTVVLTSADDALFRAQLERVAEFLTLRHRARERLRHLRFRPPFATPRPGQETTQRDLTATFERHPLVLFEAPTGFGKTGVLLEFALGQLRSGHFDRALYLTSKATGQLQVVRTLASMTDGGRQETGDGRQQNSPAPRDAHLLSPVSSAAPAVAAWHVRNKSEHCINSVYHCVRESCSYLDHLATRWPTSGLARFYLDEHHARDLATLRAAGRDARLCPYEITRAALAFNDVWIGDYNYVFAPANRTLFYNQPGWNPARTLLLLDEAHNLPSRVADAHSHVVRADDVRAVLAELDHLRSPAALVRAWESWTLLVGALQPVGLLDHALEADAADTLAKLADQLAPSPPDPSALGPTLSAILWQAPQLAAWLADPALKKLLWTPRAAELHFTCIDAADTIGETLRTFGGAVFASATLTPIDAFTSAIGLAATSPTHLRAHTPWRDAAYDLAVDARVDTTFHHRSRHFATTTATIAALHASAASCVAVFFPSYAYAETIARLLTAGFPLRIAVQPKLRDLAAQSAWVDESLAFADALFLVLGSSFAESIDSLGGRITHAMVVGPALPEVNALQRARLDEATRAGLTREQAFRRVYQIPGITRVNQALGRLVRAPGQHARVILHCQRFLEPSYASLLAPEYQLGATLLADSDLTAWLAR